MMETKTRIFQAWGGYFWPVCVTWPQIPAFRWNGSNTAIKTCELSCQTPEKWITYWPAIWPDFKAFNRIDRPSGIHRARTTHHRKITRYTNDSSTMQDENNPAQNMFTIDALLSSNRRTADEASLHSFTTPRWQVHNNLGFYSPNRMPDFPPFPGRAFVYNKTVREFLYSVIL